MDEAWLTIMLFVLTITLTVAVSHLRNEIGEIKKEIHESIKCEDAKND